MRMPPARTTSPNLEDSEQDRVDRVRSDIACRLEKSCSNLSKAEFAALVARIASVKLEGDRYRPPAVGD
jgi:hypothetical protein